MITPQPTERAKQGGANLRGRAIRGGAFIAVRQALGMVLSLIGVLFVTRIIGPAEYGLFAAAFGIVAFLANIGTWGVDVYLIRKSEDPAREEYDQAFTLLLTCGVVVAVLVFSMRNLLTQSLHMPGLSPVLSVPAIVQLDRNLRFKTVAYTELISQALNYAVSVPLALKGYGAFAPALGQLVQAATLLGSAYWAVQFKPRFHADAKLVRNMLSYGLSYSSSIWIWQVRGLINPVVVGRFAGAQGVGIVAFAIRLAEVLSFAKAATWRVAMAALAKLGGDRSRLRSSIEEGMRLQALAVGVPLALFALVAQFTLRLVFGPRWDAALVVFPFVAIGYLCNAMFNLHSSVLYLLRKNMRVTYFHLVHVGVLATAALVLVPRFGYIGYGLAEIAALSSYFVVHVSIRHEIGSLNYATAMLWFAAACVSVAAVLAPWYVRTIAVSIFALPLLLRRERNVLIGYARLLRWGEA